LESSCMKILRQLCADNCQSFTNASTLSCVLQKVAQLAAALQQLVCAVTCHKLRSICRSNACTHTPGITMPATAAMAVRQCTSSAC